LPYPESIALNYLEWGNQGTSIGEPLWKLRSEREKSIEKCAIPLDRPPKLFGIDVIAAAPLLFQLFALSAELTGYALDNVGNQAVGLFHRLARFIDEGGLHVFLKRAKSLQFVRGNSGLGCVVCPVATGLPKPALRSGLTSGPFSAGSNLALSESPFGRTGWETRRSDNVAAPEPFVVKKLSHKGLLSWRCRR